MDLEHASRKIWLVKVPAFVAKRWKGICEQSMAGEAGVGPKLANMKYTVVSQAPSQASPAGGAGASGAAAAGGSGPTAKIELNLDSELTRGIPQSFEMRTTTSHSAPMLAFSMEAKSGAVAAEGRVHQKFDLEVVRRPAGGGSGAAAGMQIDPAYRQLSRERHQAAAVKSRTVQYMKDTRLVGAPTTVAIGQKRKAPADKRVARDANELTTELFRLFERQARWSFPQLQKHTDQPSQHLKTVLSQIAVQNKRGPYRDLWELQKSFRTTAEPAAPAAGADGSSSQQEQQQP